MATTSTNLSLRLAESSDTVSVANDIADNFNTLDGKWASQSPTTLSMAASPDAGASTRVARADHTHGGPGFGAPVAVGTTNSEGSATTAARSDHVHQSGSRYLVHGPESFDLESAGSEDIIVNFPSVPTAASLVLRGRALLAGLLASHGHTITTTVTSVSVTNTTIGALTSGNASADHTHTLTTGAQSQDHTHTGTSGNQSQNHTHSATSGGQSQSHVHTGSTGPGSAHGHGLLVDQESGSSLDRGTGPVGTEFGFVESESAHTHTLSIDSASADHTHSVTTGNASVDHTHTLTTGGVSLGHTHSGTSSTQSATHTHETTVPSHGHNASGTATSSATSAGSGGFTSSTRPAGVTVTINGVDRTTALGGPFGSSGSDWNQTLNILSYITTSGEHTILLGCTTGGRLKAEVRMTL